LPCDCEAGVSQTATGRYLEERPNPASMATDRGVREDQDLVSPLKSAHVIHWQHPAVPTGRLPVPFRFSTQEPPASPTLAELGPPSGWACWAILTRQSPCFARFRRPSRGRRHTPQLRILTCCFCSTPERFPKPNLTHRGHGFRRSRTAPSPSYPTADHLGRKGLEPVLVAYLEG
jgi:hypothetical protein